MPAGDLIHISGVGLDGLLTVGGGRLSCHAKIPLWTHNARPFRGGVLANSTGTDTVSLFDRYGNAQIALPVPRYDPAALLHADLPRDFARQAFARGLCSAGDNLLIGGSSPATVTVYRLDPPQRVKSVNISMDVRNAVHGPEAWPFAF